jgi:hypothetical protein
MDEFLAEGLKHVAVEATVRIDVIGHGFETSEKGVFIQLKVCVGAHDFSPSHGEAPQRASMRFAWDGRGARLWGSQGPGTQKN